MSEEDIERSPRYEGAIVEEVYSDCYSTFSQITSTTVNDIEQLPYNISIRNIIIIFGATVGGLLFGYDTGVVSGVLINLKPQDLSRTVLSDLHRELITSITSIGSFIGSILAFPLADRHGRKTTMTVCCMIFIIAALWMALSFSLYWLIWGRFIVGIAVGVAAQCVPIYLSEISPAKVRGFILTLNSIAITGGQLLSYILAYFIQDYNHSWRYLFGISAIPALIFILLLDYIPESPRWLISQRKFDLANDTLKLIYPLATQGQINLSLQKLTNDLSIINNYNDLEPVKDANAITRSKKKKKVKSNFLSPNANTSLLQPPETNKSNSSTYLHPKVHTTHLRTDSYDNNDNNNNIQGGKLRKIHRMEPRTKRALFVGCTLMFFQQITGFNAFMYYSPIIFSKLNIEDPLLPAIIIALTNFLFTFFALKFVDSWGRRKMLLSTIWIMTVGLLLSTMGFARNNLTILLYSLVIFVGGYASAMGTVPWASVEFLPLNRRSFGASCISCTNWFTNALVSMSYLSIMNRIGTENTMLIFVFFTIMAWLFVYFCYPEVKGLTLEEIGKVYENGIDVHYIYRNYH